MAKKIPTFQDLGFGTTITTSGERLIRKDGSFNIIRKGNRRWNTYQLLIGMSTGRFILVTLSFFILINSIFAGLFLYVGIEQLNGVPKGSLISDFLYAFFFSVQTFTTVGYGGINPVGISANFVATIGATLGLVTFALVTGLFFARFSRPKSHIAFSEKALLTPYRDMMSFQCRVVNQRDHKITNITAQMTMTWLEKQRGGYKRNYASLDLERNKIVLFPLNWTIVHPITKDSPLYGKSREDLKRMHTEFLIMLTGFDESYNQVIHANSSYICKEVFTEVKFKPMYTSSNEDMTELHLDDLDEVIDL
jgi:inward rectifier potassium channel